MEGKKKKKKECSLKIEQFSEQIVHFGVPECSLHLHVLHDFQTDCLQGRKTEEQLRETLGRNGVHGLGASFQILQNLLLENLDLLL